MNNIEILIDNFEQLKKNKFIIESIDPEFFFKFGENLIQENKELKEEDKKYIVKLTDEQYRKLVDIIRNEINKEWKSKVKEKIEELKKLKEKYPKDEGLISKIIGYEQLLYEEGE